MPSIHQTQETIRDLATKAHAIATDDSRPWSERAPEVERIEADIHASQDVLKALTAEADAVARLAPLSETKSASTGDQATETKALAVEDTSHRPAIIDRDEFDAVSKSGRFSAAWDLKSVSDFTTKATLTEAAGGAGSVIPTFLPGVTNILFRRLTVADLIPTGSADGSSIIYLKESAVTNAAAAVAEGGAKPGSDLNLAQVTENWKKIATTLKVSDEMIRDYAATMSYVGQRLTLFVQLGEEDALLNGPGTGATMTGLLARSGLQTAQALGADTASDAIYKQITNIRKNAFLEPDGIIISPANWQTIRLSKDANGQYYGGGPFTGAYGAGGMAPDSLWGKPVIVTPAIADGTALVGAFQLATQRFVQGGLRLEMTNSNEDDFLKNLVAFRAEIREVLAVYRPGALGKVTGLL